MTKQPIVPLEMPKNDRKHFKQRTKNELLLRCKVGSLELRFFSSLDESYRNEILEKVFAYGNKLESSGSCLHCLWKNGFTKRNRFTGLPYSITI